MTTLLLVGAGGLEVSSAEAATLPAGREVVARDAGSVKAASATNLKFTYRHSNCTNYRSCKGSLTLSWTDGSGRLQSRTWSAFSGASGNKKITNTCERNVGRIPYTNGKNSWTGLSYTNNYFAVLKQNRNRDVDGFAFEITQGSQAYDNSQMNCGSPEGSRRSTLLIHSEMTPSQKQSNDEENHRWTETDWSSNGCIKIQYRDMVKEGGGNASIEQTLQSLGVLRENLRIPLRVTT